VSEDARDWQQVDVEDALATTPVRTDFGWVVSGFDETGPIAAVSEDGITWHRVDLPPLPNEPIIRYALGRLVLGPEDVGGVWRSWVGVLE
jgi:hypothetical protein